MPQLAYCLATVFTAATPPSFFEPSTWPPVLLAARPWVILFIVLGTIVSLVLAWQDWRRNHIVLLAIRRLEMPPSAKLMDAELAKLCARDPAFDTAAFVAQASELFKRMVVARAAGELPPRQQVSDGVHRRAQVEREIARSQGARRHHAQTELKEARLVGAFCDPHFDALHVRLAWTSRSGEVPFDLPPSEADARVARVPEELRAEVWVFVRRPTARTLQGRSPGDCPNCGAPYQGGAAEVCPHCKAVLNSGSYGWVLAQVMDYEVYRGPWRQFTGLDEMVARDPGFSPEAIEDRAALLFWKWLHARAERRPEIVQRLAAAELVEALRREADALKACKARRWTADVSVAGVDLLLMDLDSDEGRDEVCLRVRWSGVVAEFPEGQVPRVPRSSFATVLTLVRDSGGHTDVSTGVSSDRCHACRAANHDSEAGVCSFCKAPLQAGAHDFVLRDARAFEDWMARRQEHATLAQAVEQFLPSFKFVDERLRLLQVMAALVRSDGSVTRVERALLKACCRRWGIGFAQVRPVLDGQSPPPEVTIEPGSWPARAFLEGLCEAAAGDGVIDRTERALLSAFARRLGLPPPTNVALKARAEASLRALRQAGVDADEE